MRAILGIAVAAAVLTGCARTATETTVNNDGTWTRVVKLTVAKEPMGDAPPQIEKTFLVPVGEGWKFSKETKDDNLTLTGTRQLKIGEAPFGDITVKEKDGYKMRNEVSVKEIAPGRFEYRETFTWMGKKTDDAHDMKKEFTDLVEKHFKDLLDADQRTKVANAASKELWRHLFGPGDPMIMTIMSNPEYAVRKMKSRFITTLDALIAKELGEKLDKDKRRAALRAMIAEMDTSSVASPPKQPESESDQGGLISMCTSIKMPGHVVESNGEIDEVSGEVIWALYPEAAQQGPVSVYAICDVNPRR